MAALLGMFGCATRETVQPTGEQGGKATNKEAPAEGKLITGISVDATADAIVISIQANHAIDYTLAEPPLQQAKVLYFPDSGLNLSAVEYPVDNEIISTIQAIELVKGGPSKIVIPIKTPGIACETHRGDSDNILQVIFPRIASGQSGAARTKTENAIKEETVQPAENEKAVQPVGAEAARYEQSAAATRMEKLDVINETDRVTVKITANGSIKTHKIFTLKNPPRIVLDLVGLTSPFQKEQRVTVNSDIMQQVRYFGHEGYVRVVMDVKPSYLSDFKADAGGNGLMLYVGNTKALPGKTSEQKGLTKTETEKTLPMESAATAVSPTKAQEEAVAPPSVQPKEEAIAPPPVEAVTEPAPASSTEIAKEESASIGKYSRPALVNRIDFLDEQGKSTISVGTTHPVEFDLAKAGANKLKLTLKNADILSFRQRPLITTRFDSAVNSIIPQQTQVMKEKGFSVLDINLREEVGYRTEQSGNLIMVHFDRSSVSANPAQKVVIPTEESVVTEAAKPVAAKEEEPAGKPAEAAAEPPVIKAATGTPPPAGTNISVEEETPAEAAAPAAAKAGKLVANKKVYTGEPIALEFYKTDIRNVIRILRDVSGKNFAIDEGVTGSVTLSFVNPVPWDQVLDLILEMNNLGMIEDNGIVRISTKDTIIKQKEAKRAALAAEQELKTTADQQAPLVTEYFPISYADAEKDILPHISDLLTKDRGHAKVDSRTNQLIMTDIQEKLDKARDIIKEIDKVTPQVMINSRIVETSTNFSRDFGVEWGMDNSPGTYKNALGGTYTYNVAMNNPVAAATNTVGISFSRIVGTPFSLDAKLALMESVGQVKIVSSPRVVTLNKKKASISQGQEIPYLKLDRSGNTTTEFKDALLKLEVTPQVTPDNRISMNIHIEEKQVGEQGSLAEPPLNTKEANSELLVNDGDTIVIGGIIQSTEKQGESGVPYVSKIPLLGNLFKTQSRSDDNSELLIFITPTIVRLD